MSDKEISELMDLMFRQTQVQSGGAIKSRWFHDGDGCPGCGQEIDSFKFKKKNSLSLNAFIFREHGVLIAYLLCGKCAKRIIRESKTNPFAQTTELHIEIEKNLKQAFTKHLGH
ncbi:MAG: hypothetical protein ACKVRN_07220 [Pyrinomonadaceae bacterium]